MEDLRRYVLYSREQEEAFRNRYANVIAARRRAYVEWLRSLALLEWWIISCRSPHVTTRLSSA